MLAQHPRNGADTAFVVPDMRGRRDNAEPGLSGWALVPDLHGRDVSEEARAYLDGLRGKGWLENIRVAFDGADSLNIVFVGETIIDEYRYVQALAKPSKEFILATVETRAPEQFLGGVVAASLHADWRNVKVITDDGEPIKKTRYVDADFGRKLFEVYSKRRIELPSPKRAAFKRRLYDAVEAADVVVTFDFGHGLLGGDEREIVQRGKFFAVNSQTNAGNNGFNPVTKYKRADLVCVDMPEAQLAAGLQDETNPWELAVRLNMAPNLIITQGRNGATAVTLDTYHIPSFATRALDTMGAGDAFLSVAAPLVAAGLDLECAAFVGNVAGGLKTDIVGHRRHVGRDELLQTVEALLK